MRLGLTPLLALGTVSVILVVVSLSTGLDVRRERAIYQEQLSQRALVVSETLNDVLANALYFGDLDRTDDILDVVARQPDINYIQIFNLNGRLLLDTRVEQYPIGSATESHVQQAALQNLAVLSHEHEKELVVATPILIGVEAIGVANVSISTIPLETKVKEIIALRVREGIVLVAIGTLLGFLCAQYISRPIKDLARAANRVGQGDFVVPSGGQRSDEIGDLVRAFEEMSCTLQQRSREVLMAQEHLESEVVERTADLKATNEQLSAQIGERGRLQGQLEANIAQMAVVDEVARIITSSLDLSEVYERFSQELQKLVGFERLAINLVDEEAGVIKSRYVIGAVEIGVPMGETIPLQGTRTQHVLDTGRTLILNDIQENPRFPADSRFAQYGIRSTIAVPLISKSQIIGTLSLQSTQTGSYGEEKQAILERLAQQIAPAVENANLYEERKKVWEQLLQSQKLESIGRLAGGIAHDFNNLLTAIMGYSQLVLDRAPSDGSLTDFISQIQKSAERASNLTSQLLVFSRHQVFNPKVVNLDDIILDLDGMLRRLIGVDIELVTIPCPEAEPVKVDPSQLEQVLVNLAVNSRDAMPEGGKLTIETNLATLTDKGTSQNSDITPGRHMSLSVSDSGTGMTQEVQDHIFEPFYTTKEVGKGTGLGLAICYRIVKQNGGHIEVHSELGRGTCFDIYFPVTSEGRAPLAENIGISSLILGSETVLVAEDEAPLRAMVSRVLGQQGYTLLEACDGEEALKVAHQHSGKIDLLVTDVVMPRVGGVELADQFRDISPETKVLFTSGYHEGKVSPGYSSDLGTDFLQKPYLPGILVGKVRELLDR
ncbi:MAG: ATP-binding protein [Dehalococcoidia bacterium]